MTAPNRPDHIRLTSHPDPEAKARFPIQWGAATPRERGPVIGTVSKPGAAQRDRQPRRLLCALSRARGVGRRARPDPAAGPDQHLPDRDHRAVPAMDRSPERSSRSIRGDIWSPRTFKTEIAEGLDIRPSIAITKARLDLIEMRDALAAGRLKADGHADPCERQPLGGQDRDRSGLVSAGHRRSASAPPRRRCGGACSSRPPACSPSW